MVFGRRKRAREADEAAAAEEAAEQARARPDDDRPRPQGPWDVEDAPDGEPRVDLGGLQVPAPEGVEVRVEVGPDGSVVAALAVHRNSQLQLNAFAAPRLDGIWDQVRLEIAQALRGQGGAAEEVDGPFGRELRARLPGPQPNLYAPGRFVGVDGPRWFLRGLVTGPAATDPVQAATLHEVFRGTVVVRGKEAMAPRDPLPMHLPREAADAVAAAAAEAEAAAGAGGSPYGDLDPFERGPEITETR